MTILYDPVKDCGMIEKIMQSDLTNAEFESIEFRMFEH